MCLKINEVCFYLVFCVTLIANSLSKSVVQGGKYYIFSNARTIFSSLFHILSCSNDVLHLRLLIYNSFLAENDTLTGDSFQDEKLTLPEEENLLMATLENRDETVSAFQGNV